MRAGGHDRLRGHHPVLHSATRACSSFDRRVRIYYVEEDEGALSVDVMRLGAMHDTVQVSYRTDAWRQRPSEFRRGRWIRQSWKAVQGCQGRLDLQAQRVPW